MRSQQYLSILFALRLSITIEEHGDVRRTFNPLCIETVPSYAFHEYFSLKLSILFALRLLGTGGVWEAWVRAFNPLCIETYAHDRLNTIPSYGAFNPLCIETKDLVSHFQPVEIIFQSSLHWDREETSLGLPSRSQLSILFALRLNSDVAVMSCCFNTFNPLCIETISGGHKR